MERAELARVVIAGLAGDTGKTLVSLGLVRALCRRGLAVAPFKKGPDFIDAAWLGAAAGRSCRNLDTFLMPREVVRSSLYEGSRGADLALIEGNRGLFDGMDALGAHSTAQLAKLTASRVVLVVDVAKVTRTVAALVLGCRALDCTLPLAGVILNRVATARQEQVIRRAVAAVADLPVIGAIPRLRAQHLPSRHLGLVPAAEHPQVEQAIDAVADAVSEHVDLPAVLALAQASAPLQQPVAAAVPVAAGARVRIGVLRDAPFSFYYPENLAALEAAGADLVPISTIGDGDLPPIDALYAGGGFPEVRAAELAANGDLRRALRRRIAEGLPVWAECGGLIYLARELQYQGQSYPMVGALPIVVEQRSRPQGHGYVEGRVDGANPFLRQGLQLRGHEFHYSRVHQLEQCATVLSLGRGTGLGQGRDGLRRDNVVASYTHIHASGLPQWAPGLVQAARSGGGRDQQHQDQQDQDQQDRQDSASRIDEGTNAVSSMSA